MSTDCFFLNPLRRDGTSQRQRALAALDPGYARVDERTLDDLLLYTRQYAELLRYYTSSNSAGGDWVDFVEQDVTTVVALIRGTDTKGPKRRFASQVKAVENASTNVQKVEAYAKLLDPVVTLAQTIDWWHGTVSEGLQVWRDVDRLIRAALNDALRDALVISERIHQIRDSIDTIEAAVDELSSVWVVSGVEADGLLFPGGVAAISDDHLEEALRRVSVVFDRFLEAQVFVANNTAEYLRETIEDYPRHQPHMALFLAFLRLYEHAQNHINSLGGEHLDFYYERVLRLARKPASPDDAHIVFELAKNAAPHKVAKGARLNGGKDDTGVLRNYRIRDELVVNRAVIDEEHGLKTVFVEASQGDEDGAAPEVVNIFAASDADSEDGVGAELESEDGKWSTFGSTSMPFADIGFALVSPMLLLSEGSRDITIDFRFSRRVNLDAAARTELRRNVVVSITGDGGWMRIPPAEVTVQSTRRRLTYKISLSAEAGAVVGYDVEVHGGGFETTHPVLKFMLDGDGLAAGEFADLDTLHDGSVVSPADLGIVDYADDVPAYGEDSIVRHAGKLYRARQDIVNAGVRPDTDAAKWKPLAHSHPYKYFQGKGLEKVDIDLAISGVRGLVLESDLGSLDPAKPFYPFGPIPKKGSSFYMGSAEVFAKPLTSVEVSIDWADLPDESFATYYGAYGPVTQTTTAAGDTVDTTAGAVSGNGHFTATIELLNRGEWHQLQRPAKKGGSAKRAGLSLDGVAGIDAGGFAGDFGSFGGFGGGGGFGLGGFDAVDAADPIDQPERGGSLPPTSHRLFKSDQETGAPAIERVLGPALAESLDYAANLEPFTRFDASQRRGFLRLKLETDFLHKEHLKYLARAATNDGELMPNPPYAPLVASLKLSYDASRTIDYSAKSKNDFEDRVEKIYQVGPFGNREIFPIADDPSATGVSIDRSLVPHFDVTVTDKDGNEETKQAEGTLLVGIAKLEPEQNLSLLLRVAEGSEDPRGATQPIVWSYLSHDEWVDFKRTEILAEGTNGLLGTGIITFVMPKAMTTSEKLLPGKLHWIKASVHRESTSVPKLVGLHTQAATARFRDDGNDPLHLSNPLPAESIGKLMHRDSAIKSVSQPYASFGGRLEEADAAFRVRVSERLRHKGRAVTIFDYERLVLEAFPEVYKVKCLNHSSRDCEHAPGRVNVVVVPDLRNQNAVDPLRPQLSRNKLTRIEQFLYEISSDFVTIRVSNPSYERVRSRFDVRFQKGRDQGLYTTRLQKDLVRFLSPWLYDDAADLTFGGRIHRSAVLNFVEELEYVDFVTNFEIDQIIEAGEAEVERGNIEEAEATTSGAALVSATDHAITHNITACDDDA